MSDSDLARNATRIIQLCAYCQGTDTDSLPLTGSEPQDITVDSVVDACRDHGLSWPRVAATAEQYRIRRHIPLASVAAATTGEETGDADPDH